MKIKEANAHLNLLKSDILTSQELNSAIEFFEKFINEVEDYWHRSISWNIDDFVSKAQELKGNDWDKYYNKSKFQSALYKMIHKHDSEHGITWVDIDFYLEEYCKK